MLKNKTIYSYSFILAFFLFNSCTNTPNTTENELIKINKINKDIISNLQTIVLKDKIILNKPLSINNDSIKKEIEELNNHKLNSDEENKITYWKNSVLRWNEIAHSLVIKYKTNALESSRVYELLSIAQYDSLINTYQNKYLYNRGFRENIKLPSYPSEKASIAESSSLILSYLYPNEKEFLTKKSNENKEVGFWGKEHLRSDIKAGEEIGKIVSEKIIEFSKHDNFDKANNQVEHLKGEGFWEGSFGLLPSWGKVKAWTFESKEDLITNSPPKYNSDEFKKELDELIKITNNLNDEQKKIIDFWSDGLEEINPLVYWNKKASELIDKNNFNEFKSSYILAFMNISMIDSGIYCWNTKYKYQLLRPSQASNKIKMSINLPNSPSYVSENAIFSGSASEFLSYIFPDEKKYLNKISEEASISGLYSGIHYRFDIEEGLNNGKQIGKKSIELLNSKLKNIENFNPSKRE